MKGTADRTGKEQANMSKKLDELATRHGTDKGPVDALGRRGHHFTSVYSDHLGHMTGTRFRMLEIGVQSGASIRMWRDFFPQAEIVGIDRNPKCARHAEGNVTIEIVDQGDPDAMRAFANRSDAFDVIIDDGGHTMRQQIVSFELLFPKLAGDGIYYIEDTHTSYMSSFREGVDTTTVEYFKNMVDAMNLGKPISTGMFVEPVALNVRCVEFYAGLIAIRKGSGTLAARGETARLLRVENEL
jgi:hypothetical protein